METASRIWQRVGECATGTRNCSNNSTIRSQSSRPPLKAIPCGRSAFTKTNNAFCFPLVWRRPRENLGPVLSKSFCLGSQQVIASPPLPILCLPVLACHTNCVWACDKTIRQHLTDIWLLKSCSGGTKLGLQKVVLFSKLNTLKFPTPEHIIRYLEKVLAPARELEFELLLRRVPKGAPYSGAIVEVDVGTENPVTQSTDNQGKVRLRLPFGKDFEARGSGCDAVFSLHPVAAALCITTLTHSP